MDCNSMLYHLILDRIISLTQRKQVDKQTVHVSLRNSVCRNTMKFSFLYIAQHSPQGAL